MYEYKARVEKVIDGDTFIAVVDLGFYTYVHQHFRLLNYEAPEIRGPEKCLGVIAKAKLEDLLKVGTEIVIRTEKADGFGRWLAEVPLKRGTLSERLIKLGYGVPRRKNEKRVPFDPTGKYPLRRT